HARGALLALCGDKACGAQCALREVRARPRLVRKLDALSGTGEDDAVVTDDVTAAQHGKANRARLARPGRALACIHGARLEITTRRPRCRIAEQKRGSRRRVRLVTVVHLE